VKILHVKVNGIVTKENAEKIERRIKDNLEKGLLISDNTMKIEVLEFDEIRVDV